MELMRQNQDKSEWEKVIRQLREAFPKLHPMIVMSPGVPGYMQLFDGLGSIRIDWNFNMEITYGNRTFIKDDHVKKYLGAWCYKLEGVELDMGSTGRISIKSKPELLDGLSDFDVSLMVRDIYTPYFVTSWRI
jgi:hypothetical protein